jgi:hypothetical protein
MVSETMAGMAVTAKGPIDIWLKQLDIQQYYSQILEFISLLILFIIGRLPGVCPSTSGLQLTGRVGYQTH